MAAGPDPVVVAARRHRVRARRPELQRRARHRDVLPPARDLPARRRDGADRGARPRRLPVRGRDAREVPRAYDLSWGHLKAITFPAPGNDHDQSGAGDYLSYWASRLPSTAPFQPYSFDLGTWHLVSLPSNCRNPAIDCTTGGTLDRWLRSDLAAHPAACTLAFWHNPRWNSPVLRHPSSEFRVEAFAQALYDADADVVLSGDVHEYERFAPQDPANRADPSRGLTQFVVGTGGKTVNTATAVAPNSLARDGSDFGVLRMGLHAGGYDWRFVTETGRTVDAGTRSCH